MSQALSRCVAARQARDSILHSRGLAVLVRWASRGLLLAASGGLAACAGWLAPQPAPELLERIEIPYTQGVPIDPPLPDLQGRGLSEEELITVAIHRERVRAVVNVTSLSAYRSRLSGAFPLGGSGSGFIIDQRGTVITNHHVVQGAQRLIVTLYDGSHYPARLIGSDEELDLAVLRFEPQGRRLWVLPRGDSQGLQVGQGVIALGNPFGLDGTLTTGVVSALNRPLQLGSGFIIRNLIQTDAAINPGDSGGPLLNRQGEVIGINSLIVSPSSGNAGVGLAVPIHSAVRVINEILSLGRVVRGWIEIEGVAMDARLVAARGGEPVSGILVTRVLPGGNAAQAGLQDGREGRQVRYGPHRLPIEGDVIVAFAGAPIASVPDLLAALVSSSPGDEVSLSILRAGQRRELKLRLTARPPPRAEAQQR